MNDLSFRLKLARNLRGYSKSKDFAEGFNLPYSTYSQHEVGSRSMSIKVLFEYSNMLGIRPEWLLTGRGNPSDSSSSLPNIDKEILLEIRENENSGNIDAVELPLINENLAISNIQVDVLKLVLEKSLVSAKKYDSNLDAENLSSFVLSLYNKVVGLDVGREEAEEIVDISLASYFLGVSSGQSNKFRKIDVA